MSTGYLWDKRYLGHLPGRLHPEHPDRARELEWSRMKVDVPGLIEIPLVNQINDHWVRKVHSSDHADLIRNAFAENRWRIDNGDTLVKEDTWEVAMASASGALSVLNAVCAGRVRNGFAAIRPPGHHAGRTASKGFCYFNNAAICARYAQEFHNIERVMIIDWDVHPGDGTMNIFYEDPHVYLLSLHQAGIFSDRVGTRDQTGRGPGEGLTENVPIEKGSGETEWLRELEPALDRGGLRCKPGLIIISAGFDAHQADPLGGMKLHEESFRKMTTMVKQLADQYCDGRIVSILEGGYSVNALGRSVRAHVEELLTA